MKERHEHIFFFLCNQNQNLVFWLGLKGREELIRQTPMGCTTFKTLNDYHSSLTQKRKKEKTPNKRKETNAKSMFLSHGHEEGGKT